MTKEQKFYKALQDVFIGAKVEGIGGFINLMKIKATYYSQIEKILEKDINKALEKHPAFREELFDKLYNFFNRYFTENGSIYFNSTPFHNNIYEKVYTDDNDVILFWKTHMLYYVKTDRIFNSMPVELGKSKFFFDASKMQNKKSNEKRTVIYELKEIREDETIVFEAKYSERNTKTKTDEILKEFKEKNISITEEFLISVFKIFEKQSEVDYFINKNARVFLSEQFKLWSYQYFWDGAKEWQADRVNQLQIMKEIAFKVIDFIGQFENELVKIWNKPKFVFNSNYVISLKTLKSILNSENYKKIKKLVYLYLNENQLFQNDIIETVKDICKKPLQKVYVSKVVFDFKNEIIKMKYIKIFDEKVQLNNYLKKSDKEKQIDIEIYDRKTKLSGYFGSYSTDNVIKQIEFEKIYIDTVFFDKNFREMLLQYISENNAIDNVINGYLVKSDNYQFLNSVNKFNKRIRAVYIDPPFNTENEGFAYLDKFKDSTWLTMIRDRVQIAKDKFLATDGSLYIHLDHNCNYIGRQLLENIFNKEADKEIIWNTGEALSGFKTQALNWIRQHDTIFYYSKEKPLFNKMWVKNDETKVEGLGWMDIFKGDKDELYIYKYKDGQNKLSKTIIPPVELKAIGDIWNDVLSLMYTQNMTRENWGEDNTQKPENLLRRIIQSATNENDFVMDFFLGSGTTIAAAHKLNRKWIGVEMGDFLESVVLKRIKTVVFGDIRPKLSEDLNWQGGGVFKYYEMEQYENVLEKCKFADGDLFNKSGEKAYQDYVFMKDEKMLTAVEIDYEKNKVKVNLDKIYPNIDIAETISNLTGKWIRKISKNIIEYDDGTVVDTNNIDYKLIKPLIWW